MFLKLVTPDFILAAEGVWLISETLLKFLQFRMLAYSDTIPSCFSLSSFSIAFFSRLRNMAWFAILFPISSLSGVSGNLKEFLGLIDEICENEDPFDISSLDGVSFNIL